MAKLIGVNKSAISTYENDIRQPSFEILVRLANLYRVSTDYLLGQTNTRTIDLSELTEEEANYICGLVELIFNHIRTLILIRSGPLFFAPHLL